MKKTGAIKWSLLVLSSAILGLGCASNEGTTVHVGQDAITVFDGDAKVGDFQAGTVECDGKVLTLSTSGDQNSDYTGWCCSGCDVTREESQFNCRDCSPCEQPF